MWNLEQTNLTGKVTRFVVTRGRGGAGERGVLEKGDEKIQTPIYKILSPGNVTYSMATIVNSRLLT